MIFIAQVPRTGHLSYNPTSQEEMHDYDLKKSMAPIQLQQLLEWRPDDADMIRIRHRGPLIVPFATTKLDSILLEYSRLSF